MMTRSSNKSWSQHLFPFSDKTPHKNKLETNLKKERSFYFISFPLVLLLLFGRLRCRALSRVPTDLNNETGEKSLFPRTQKDCISFNRGGVAGGIGVGG